MPRDGGLNSSVGPNWLISLTFIATTLTAVVTASMLGSLLTSCTQQAVLRWEQQAPNFHPRTENPIDSSWAAPGVGCSPGASGPS